MPLTEAHDFSGYRQFTANLRRLADEPLWSPEQSLEVTASLDGVAGRELRSLVELSARRAFGAFFTGSELAEKLLGTLPLRSDKHFIYDPAVGAGDLLLAAARRLPCEESLSSTLAAWGKCLGGTDLHPEFIEATQLRIALLARQRHCDRKSLPPTWRKHFPHIRCGDGLEQRDLFSRATHVVMNPPYCLTEPDARCSWAGGRISVAALFVIRALELAPGSVRIFAILPDVLRSGAFQNNWRERVSDLATVEAVKLHGIFDETADVDVFLLELCKRGSAPPRGKRWPLAVSSTGRTVGDSFEVHVGRVVPHRDVEEGPLRRFIDARNIPVWEEVTRISGKRRHRLAYQPPFVVLRRTSRPGHPYRAAATIILGKSPVAVENHLIVCEPRDKSADTCRELMAQLKTQRVNDFLDERIRCRHLTVGSVAAIPFEPI